ncbi:MAG: PAS domain S-box protein [Elusimicrobia bacterium]|nr:PAS domain S-box protein [Elusimicrobiota bacterium]
MPKIKIIIVEDETIIAEDLQQTLRDFGYSVPSIVRSGARAIEEAEKHNPDLILMDVRLEGAMDGVETAKRIKLQLNIPVIFVTAYVDDKILKQAKVVEPYGYLVKPIDERELKSTIEIALYRVKMETELRKNEEKYRILVEGAADFIFMIDKDNKILSINKSALMFFEKKSEEIIGRSIFDLFPKEIAEDYSETIKGVFKTGTVNISEAKLITDKKQIWASTILNPVMDSNGKVTSVIGLSRDITERRDMQNELQKTNMFLHSILDSSSHVSIISTDSERNIIYWNKGAENILGYKSEEMVNRRKIDILYFDEESKDMAEKIRYDIYNNKESVSCDIKEKTKNGDMVWINMTLTPRFDEKGQVAGILGMGQDITERKKAEVELSQAEEKYRMQFEGALDAIFVADTETGIIIDCNPAASKLVGRDKSEIIGQHQRILHPPEKIEQKFTATFMQHVKDKQGQTLETQVITRDGEIRHVAIKANIFEFRGKKISQGIFRDITEQKKAEREKEKLQAQIIAQSRLASIGELASGLAHEIGNPLQTILGNTELLLLERKTNETQAIKTAVLYAKQIIENLLTFSRQRKINLTRVNINDLLEQSLSLYGKQLELKKIKVIKEYNDLPGINISSLHIEQVFLNLITNATKAMPEGGTLTIATKRTVEIGKTVGKASANPEFIEISFKDTGVGIKREDLMRVFEPFYTTRSHGTGLGLSVSYGLVQQHGGEILAFSEGEGKGAEFVVKFPTK